jgi:hypothetical protein
MKIRLHKSEGYVPEEETIIQKAGVLADRLYPEIQKEEDGFVKFNAMVYLLSDFYIAEILKGTMDIKSMQRSLVGVTKQMLVNVEKEMIHIRNSFQ